MAQVRRRQGNRFPTKVSTPIVVFVLGKRIEGEVVDRSDKGLGVLLPANCGLEAQKSVRVLFEKRQQMAKVARVEPSENGDRVGLKLLA